MLDPKCFDAVGFKAPDFAEFNRYIDTANLRGEHPTSERGRYTYWSVGDGIEVWSAFDKNQRPMNNNPHYQGSSRVTVQLLAMHDFSSTIEGILKLQTVPATPGAPHPAFFCNMPSWDFARPLLKAEAAKGGPVLFDLQLTAFAESLHCFPDEESFVTTEAARQKELAEQAAVGIEHDTLIEPFWEPVQFLPSVLFSEDKKPLPKARIAGQAERARILTNPVTKQQTLYLGVKTAGLTLDVVADPAIITGRPKHHGIVCGHFWLSGRLVPEIEATNKRLHIG